MPHKSDSNDHKGTALSRPLKCLYTHAVFFFLLKTLHLSHYFPTLWSSFLQSPRVGALSLTPGLVGRIWCSHHHSQTSISGRELSPAGQGHPRWGWGGATSQMQADPGSYKCRNLILPGASRRKQPSSPDLSTLSLILEFWPPELFIVWLPPQFTNKEAWRSPNQEVENQTPRACFLTSHWLSREMVGLSW